MSTTPQGASVVIPCYNYGRFVASAIESALAQTHPFRSVIVVDDGSTDNSRAIIEGYGDRVRSVFKANGGHASALNAGFEEADGDVVFLLDADDELRPEAVETVLAAWRPETVLLQSRPSLMDRDGRDIPGTVPGPWAELDEGDLREPMLRTGVVHVTVTSGLVFSRDAIERVLPIPEERFAQGADGYLTRAVAFQGRIQALDSSLSRYRRHGENDSELGITPAQVAQGLRKKLAFDRNELDTIRAFARQQGLDVAADLGERIPEHLLLRLGSLVADPERHPVPEDTPTGLLRAIFESSRLTPPGALPRARMLGLATALVVLPGKLGVRPLAWAFTPASRPRWLSWLLARRRALRTS